MTPKKIKKLKSDGVHISEIAKRADLTYGRIYQILKDYSSTKKTQEWREKNKERSRQQRREYYLRKKAP